MAKTKPCFATREEAQAQADRLTAALPGYGAKVLVARPRPGTGGYIVWAQIPSLVKYSPSPCTGVSLGSVAAVDAYIGRGQR